MSALSEQLQILSQENELLQLQLAELNLILSAREEELALLRKEAAGATELRSRLDAQLDEIHSMQNLLGRREQQVQGAEERELELHQELTASIQLQHRYQELESAYAYLQAQLTDLQNRYGDLQNRNQELQQMAARLAESESTLAGTVLERDHLKQLLKLYKSQSAAALPETEP